MQTVLIIEDESELRKVLRAYLEQAGYKVIEEARGDSGLSSWEENDPDMVLLDLNLPGMDGLEVAREIRRGGDTPLIMVTARVDEIDRLIGLELGADDYITKPFSPRELVARVKTVLRRAKSAQIESEVITVLDLSIDSSAFLVRQGDKTLDLTPTEFNILAALACHPGRVYSRMQLLEASQGEAYEGYERTIDAHIKNLRKKLKEGPDGNPYIETVFGIGYRFAA